MTIINEYLVNVKLDSCNTPVYNGYYKVYISESKCNYYICAKHENWENYTFADYKISKKSAKGNSLESLVISAMISNIEGCNVTISSSVKEIGENYWFEELEKENRKEIERLSNLIEKTKVSKSEEKEESKEGKKEESAYNSYNIISFANEILESGIYNGQIYEAILTAKEEIRKIDIQLSRYENTTKEINTLTEKQLSVRENLFNSALERREKVAQNLHSYLLDNSDKYKAIISLSNEEITDNEGKFNNKFTLLDDKDVQVIESYDLNILQLANNIDNLVKLIQANKDNKNLYDSLCELYFNIASGGDHEKYDSILFNREDDEEKQIIDFEKSIIENCKELGKMQAKDLKLIEDGSNLSERIKQDKKVNYKRGSIIRMIQAYFKKVGDFTTKIDRYNGFSKFEDKTCIDLNSVVYNSQKEESSNII